MLMLAAALLLPAASAPLFAQSEDADENAADAAEEAVQEVDPNDPYALMQVFVDTFEEIDRSYVKDVNRRDLVEAAIRGMLSELDPYSDYISPDDLDHFNEAITQEFGGVGIRVEFDSEARAIRVMSPLPGSPAYEAGIHSGDLILEIAGHPVRDFPAKQELNRAVELLRGKPGEKVEVGVRHVNSEEIEKITITRDLIQLDTVLGYSYNDDGTWDLMLDPDKKIGYLRLTHFTRRSPAEVREALRELKRQGMKGLILDLRTNPGGLLEAAVEIADLFLDKGLIVRTDGRNSIPRSWSAKSFGTFTGFPMAVIINNYSASASEILSAALQDHDRAVVVGQRSFGKGSVQDVIKLEDGKSVLKLTTASYHRPSGKNIHRFPNAKEDEEWGVSPNEEFEVVFNFEKFRKYQEDRRRRDSMTPSAVKSNKEEEGSEELEVFVDDQLERAREYIEQQLSRPATASEEKATDEADEEETEEANEGKKAASLPPLYPIPQDRAA